MTYFLTSSPSFGHDGPMNPANGLVDSLRAAVRPNANAVFVASAPDEHDFSAAGAWNMRAALEGAGLTFASFVLLERRNAEDAAALIKAADFLIFSGGHVPTQNRFFQDISLRERLKRYDGVVMGVSAGTMNSADTVYAQPELEGESVDPEYKRFLPGLGLTQKMLLPHYQETKDFMLDGKRLFEDITYPDSMGREFFCVPDGSYLYGEDGREEFRGEVWRLADGKLSAVAPADLERRFARDMLDIYKTAKEECGYNATRFLQLVSTKGGLAAAKQVISKPGGTDGFTTLYVARRLDLSVEAHVLKPEYAPLFTDEERGLCRGRLEQFGYHVDGD